MSARNAMMFKFFYDIYTKNKIINSNFLIPKIFKERTLQNEEQRNTEYKFLVFVV